VADSFCGTVRVRSFYTATAMHNLYIELTTMTPPTGNEALNSDPAVPDVSDTLGLFAYRNLGVAGAPDDSDAQLWVFPDNGMSFTFGGRAMADLVTGAPQPAALGDIVINEIMQNPDATTDTVGEWFEVYNATGAPLDLNGCAITDNGANNHTIGHPVIVPANGYVVLARSDTPGFGSPAYDYASFTLTNDDDEIILTCGGTEIDRVEYDETAGWPDPTGASMMLNPAQQLGDNNVGANWCAATTNDQGNGDLATPNGANDPC